MPEITDPELLKELNAHRVSTAPVKGRGTNEIDVAAGIAQGLIDPVEGLVQILERSTGKKLAPERVRDLARTLRDRAQASGLGIAGEVVGNILPAILTMGESAPLTAASILPRAAAGATMGALQPVRGDSDFWNTKVRQALLGAGAGVTLPALASAARRLPSAVLHGTGLPAWLAHRMGSVVSVPAGAIESLPSGMSGRVAGLYRGTHPTEREDEEAVPTRAPSVPPAAIPIPDSTLMEIVRSFSGNQPRRPSELGGMAGQAVDRARGEQNAQTQ